MPEQRYITVCCRAAFVMRGARLPCDVPPCRGLSAMPERVFEFHDVFTIRRGARSAAARCSAVSYEARQRCYFIMARFMICLRVRARAFRAA